MTDFLIESGLRAGRPALVQAIMTGRNAKYEQDKQTMNALVEESMLLNHPPGFASADTALR